MSMTTNTHTIRCVDGEHTIRLDIFRVSAVEAIDVYEQDAIRFRDGGWRIEGSINGVPAGTQWHSGALGSLYYGQDDSRDVALSFLADARRNGALPRVA